MINIGYWQDQKTLIFSAGNMQDLERLGQALARVREGEPLIVPGLDGFALVGCGYVNLTSGQPEQITASIESVIMRLPPDTIAFASDKVSNLSQMPGPSHAYVDLNDFTIIISVGEDRVLVSR